ncbi:MAG: SDR family oxidoreductase [Polyangia bacterium]
MRSFAGKLALVTGGSSGIGLASARRLAGEGAHVILVARDATRLEQARLEVAGCAREAGQRIVACSLDVADHAAVRTRIPALCSEHGAPDLLINCAGRARPDYFERILPEQLDDTLRVNLYSAFHVTQAALPFMRGRGGHVVNVSSIAGFLGVFGYADYSAAKFALIGLSEVLCSELRPHKIRVSVLCPPDTDTPGLVAENETKPPETRALSQGAKLLTADAVAEALLRGVRRGRFLIIPGLDGKLIYLLKRLWPGAVRFFMHRTVRGAQAVRSTGARAG